MPPSLRLATLLLLIFNAGCSGTSAPERVSECLWTGPLTWSRQDTEETQRQIFAHNLKWEELCGGETTPAAE